MEIERKYLVAALPEGLEACEHAEIEQGYICTSPTLRIRRMGDVFVLTVKEKVCTASSAIVNREEEFSLSEEAYNRLKTKCEGQMVCKTRYRLPLGELTAELDVFHGTHEGLRVVEVEFPTVEASECFVAPEWFGEEVSSDPRYRNSHLSSNNETPTA